MAALALVDDEPTILRVMSLLLSEEGWDVSTFACAEDAVEPLRRGAFAALVTDHVLPGMTGLELALQTRAVHPAMPCVVISGHPAPEGCALPWFAKPVDLDALLRVISPA
ncbi:MAG: response regulator [Polyangiales bacterium]